MISFPQDRASLTTPSGPCLYCGSSHVVSFLVTSDTPAPAPGPYALWYCGSCGSPRVPGHSNG